MALVRHVQTEFEDDMKDRRLIADLDAARQARLRLELPALEHRVL